MIYTTFSVPTAQTVVIRVRNWWANGGQELTLHAVERGAEMFSDALTQAMLDAIESGIIVRRWWERSGRDHASAIGWQMARGAALLVVLIACLVCLTGFAVAAAAKASPVVYRWIKTVGVPAVVKSLDKGCAFVLCYEEQSVATVQDAKKFSLPGDGVTAWAVARWPQLG